MEALRIKMPLEFVDEDKSKDNWERAADLLHECEKKKRVYEVSWESGGTVSVHETREGAYRAAAVHIVKSCHLLNLREVDVTLSNEKDCECLCHQECQCPVDEHKPDSDDCHFEDCGTYNEETDLSTCCESHLDGNKTAALLLELFQREAYSLLLDEWNSFWLTLQNAQADEDDEEGTGDYSNNELNIVPRTVRP
jgi:hypothetical protein